MNIYEINRAFESELAKYTGAKYCALIDNCSNAIFLSLMYEGILGKTIIIPSHTYISVPCEIIHAGGKVEFAPATGNTLTGAYPLLGSKTWDSALRLTADMYIPGSFMCLSFTGPSKRINLGKGGAILTDDKEAYEWFKRKRYSGRREMNYHEDTFDMIGWNFMMLPEVAAKGLSMIPMLYNEDGSPKHFPDITRTYPDLSKYPVYKW